MQHPAFTVHNSTGDSDWLLVCEHASNAIPESLKQLGLSEAQRNAHIAYDIGAEMMTHYLSEQLNATAITCNYSRLVIDCNRPLSDASCLPAISDEVVIPGNKDLTASEKAYRIQHIYQPFHQCVFQTLTDKLTVRPQTKLLNIHSFTPMLASEKIARPWDIGFIHRDDDLAHAVLAYFKTHSDYCIGDNAPYNGYIHKGYTIWHAEAQAIPSLLVEFRQDAIHHFDGVKHWGDALLAALNSVQQSKQSH